MKYLFLAEKNSVMRAVEDAYKKNKAVIDEKLGGEVIFTALSGHVCRWLEPSEYKEWKDEKWADLELPLTPEPFLIAGSKEKYASGVLKDVKALIEKEDPDAFIVGTDSDVEGNGIFYLLSENLGITDKPTLRFFEQSLTEKEVVNSLLNMTDFYKEPRDIRMTNTFITRSQFDWLVGMNATIAISVRAGELYRVGRVKAPTLKLVYDNSLAIDNFVPHSDFQIKANYEDNFTGLMLSDDESDGECFETKEKAEEFIESLSDKDTAKVLSIERKKKSSKAPVLYKLSALQGDAGSKYNYSPKETLDTVQELYEKKFLTYPRTDGTCVSTAKADTFSTLIHALTTVEELQEYANNVTGADINRVRKNKKVVNDEEVKRSSHDALLPTETAPNFASLSIKQKNIYLLVAKRFLAQFLPDKEDESTTLIAEIDGRKFKSTGSKNIEPGWSVLYDNKEKSEKIPETINEGDEISVSDIVTHEKKSKPPARLTSASLVTAMENIAKYIGDKYLKDVMTEAKGIGTQATRADIIEQLINSKYISCEGKNNALSITDLGKRYMETMKAFSITDPSSAAEWESMFQSVREGTIDIEEAKEKTLDYVYDFIEEIAKAEIKVTPRKVETIDAKCPYCGGTIRKLKWGYACENSNGEECNFKLSSFNGKVKDKDVIELINTGITRKIKDISKSKTTGKAFSAMLKLSPKGSTEAIRFTFDAPKELPVKCPYCEGRIFEHDWGYGCENTRDKSCNFMVSNKRKKIKATDIEALVVKGKTELIKGIGVSTKTKKPFDAYLVLNEKGSENATSYEFPPREALPEVPDDLTCPYCTGKIVARRFTFECENKAEKKCVFSVSRCDGLFTVDDLKDLITDGSTRYIDGLKSSKGSTYSAGFTLLSKEEAKKQGYATERIWPPRS